MVWGCIERERVSAVDIDRIWNAGILDGHNLLPKLLPDLIAKMEILEGDGGLGTVKMIHFTQARTKFRFAVDKIDVFDPENYTVRFAVVDGGLIGTRLESYSFEVEMVAGSDDETTERAKVEYETLDDTPLSDEEEDQIMQGWFIMSETVEEYLLANPSAYT